jgi:NAD kinase
MGLVRSQSELCLGHEHTRVVTTGDAGAGIGPAAAAACAAAGVRHWLRSHSRPAALTRGSSAPAWSYPMSPPTPERGEPRRDHERTTEAEVSPPPASPPPPRASFRLLCTVPHADSDEEAGASGAEDECSCETPSSRDVAAVLPCDRAALSEDVLRAAQLASSPAVSALRRRRRAAGVALQLQWLAPPRNVLLVVKPDGGDAVDNALRAALQLLRAEGCVAYVEPSVARRLRDTTPRDQQGPAAPELCTWDDCAAANGDEHALRPAAAPPPHVAESLDLVVTLGGDGTVLWTSHLLGDGPLPPVLSFSLGSLCFMTPFAASDLASALRSALSGDFNLTLRHRLVARVFRADGTPAGPAAAVLNDVVFDRGSAPYLANLEAFCDGAFLTRVQGDGLIVSTPSGSTAYNLAAGGSMVHPSVPALMFTPICPHSLSFRPLVLPDSARLRIRVPASSRGSAWASFDGRGRIELLPGDSVRVALSRFPMPTVCAADATTDWFAGVRETLHWNERRVQGVTRKE